MGQRENQNFAKTRERQNRSNSCQKNVLRAKIELREAKPCSKSSKNILFEQDPAKP